MLLTPAAPTRVSSPSPPSMVSPAPLTLAALKRYMNSSYVRGDANSSGAPSPSTPRVVTRTKYSPSEGSVRSMMIGSTASNSSSLDAVLPK